MEGRVLFNLQGFATSYPLGVLPAPPLGNPMPPFAIQNVDAGWHIHCYNFNSCSMQNFANGMDSVGQGPWLLQTECAATRFRSRGPRHGLDSEERASGWQGHRSLWQKTPCLLQKECHALRAVSLMDLAAAYPQANPLRPLASKKVRVLWRACYFNSSSMHTLVHSVASVGGSCRPFWMELLQKQWPTVHTESLMDSSTLICSRGFATRYPLSLSAFQHIRVRWHNCYFSSASRCILAHDIDPIGGVKFHETGHLLVHMRFACP